MTEHGERIKGALDKIKDKDFGIYFFVLDTKGNPTAGVATIYEHVKLLRELGFDAKILHDKNDYKLRGDENNPDDMGLVDWLGEEYGEIPHVSIESQDLQVGPADFIVIPEAFASIMKQTANFPSKRVVFLQSYEYIFEMLEIGESWTGFNISDVVTTNGNLKNYVESVFRNLHTEIVPIGIPEYFKDSDKPKVPTVAISARDKRELLKVVKVFYQKYPHYQFVTFRDMSGLPREEFAKELGKSFLSVWVDELSSFGTFPIESIKCNTPVIGKIPRMVPEWMGRIDETGTLHLNDNGIWTSNLNGIPDMIATMVGLYLEDALPKNVVEGMEEWKNKFTEDGTKEAILPAYENIIKRRVNELEALLKNEEAKEVEQIENTNVEEEK
jgi:hypothetical protein